MFKELKSKWVLEIADQTYKNPKFFIIFSNMQITAVNGRWYEKLVIYSSLFSRYQRELI